MDVPLVEFVATAEKFVERLRPTAARWAPTRRIGFFAVSATRGGGCSRLRSDLVRGVPFAKPGEAPFNAVDVKPPHQVFGSK